MIKEMLKYLKNPEYIFSPISLNIKSSILIIGKSILIYFGFILVSSIIIILPLKTFNLLPAHILKDLPLTFKILILIPLYEELAFRLPLRFPISNLFLSIGTFVFLFLNKVVSIYISLGVGLAVALIPYLNFINNNQENRIYIFYTKNYGKIFYILFISFGLLHLFGFKELELVHFLIAPLIVINQIFLGFLLSYIRVRYKYGFLYCFFTHALINLFFLVPKNIL